MKECWKQSNLLYFSSLKNNQQGRFEYNIMVKDYLRLLTIQDEIHLPYPP